MCLVDSSASIDIDSEEIGRQYQCVNCSYKFRGLGKKLRCPICESTNVREVD